MQKARRLAAKSRPTSHGRWPNKESDPSRMSWLFLVTPPEFRGAIRNLQFTLGRSRAPIRRLHDEGGNQTKANMNVSRSLRSSAGLPKSDRLQPDHSYVPSPRWFCDKTAIHHTAQILGFWSPEQTT